MRTIIRFSVDGEKDSRLRNKLKEVLVNSKLTDTHKTATYEGKTTVKKLAACLQRFWQTVDQHQGSGKIDHFWMYCDKKKSKKVGKTSTSKPRNLRKNKGAPPSRS
ncbi:MAG: hypothetical protein ACYC46_10325 [Acidobacteriaceae bacterium]